MKRLLLSLAIGLGSLTATSVTAATPVFNAQQMAKTKIPELNFKYIMRQFYSGQMVDVNADLNHSPNIGLVDPDTQILKAVALMRPVIEYQNASGETRYLVVIEKLMVNDGDLDTLLCRFCEASGDAYTFKRLDSGVYQLVSKSLPSIEFPEEFGRITFDSLSMRIGIEPIGKDLVGSIYKNMTDGYVQEVSSWWHVMHLPEDDYIDIYDLGDAGGNSTDYYEEGSPLAYKYDVAYKVLSDNNSKYYPIKMTYLGDMPNYDTGRIEYVNHNVIKKLNPAKKEYQ